MPGSIYHFDSGMGLFLPFCISCLPWSSYPSTTRSKQDTFWSCGRYTKARSWDTNLWSPVWTWYCSTLYSPLLMLTRLGSFVNNPQLLQYCNDQNSDGLASLRDRFEDLDRIKAFLEKEKLVLFPQGQEANKLIVHYTDQPYLPDEGVSGLETGHKWSLMNSSHIFSTSTRMMKTSVSWWPVESSYGSSTLLSRLKLTRSIGSCGGKI